MKEMPVLDELRGVRRRLAEEQKLDVNAYAAMLRACADTSSGQYRTEPILPRVEPMVQTRPKYAG